MLALIGHYSWSWLGKEGRCSHGPWLPVMDRARQFSSIPWPLMHKDKRLWKLPDPKKITLTHYSHWPPRWC